MEIGAVGTEGCKATAVDVGVKWRQAVRPRRNCTFLACIHAPKRIAADRQSPAERFLFCRQKVGHCSDTAEYASSIILTPDLEPARVMSQSYLLLHTQLPVSIRFPRSFLAILSL